MDLEKSGSTGCPSSFPNLFFSPRGRVGRCNWWFAKQLTLATGIAIFVLGLLLISWLRNHTHIDPRSVSWLQKDLAIIIAAKVLYVLYCIYVKRWHDRAKSAWWMLLSLTPLLTWVAMGVTFIPTINHHLSAITVAIICGVFGFIALIASLWNYIELGFFRGDVGTNFYGEDPYAQPNGKATVGKVVVSIILYTITLILILTVNVVIAKDFEIIQAVMEFNTEETSTQDPTQVPERLRQMNTILKQDMRMQDRTTNLDAMTAGLDLADAKQCLDIGDVKIKIIRNEREGLKRLVSWIVPITNKCDKNSAFSVKATFKDTDGFEIGNNNALFDSANLTKIIDPGIQEVTGAIDMDATVYLNATKLDLKFVAPNTNLKEYNLPLDMAELNRQDEAQKTAKEFGSCYTPMIVGTSTDAKDANTLVTWDDWSLSNCEKDKPIYYKIEISGTKTFVSDTFTMTSQHSQKNALIPADLLSQPNLILTLHYSCDDKFADCKRDKVFPIYQLLPRYKGPQQSMFGFPPQIAPGTTFITHMYGIAPPVINHGTNAVVQPAPINVAPH